MFKRPLFLLGLLLAAFAAFRLRLPKPRPQPAPRSDFQDFVSDALLIQGSTGTVEANGPAQTLFGEGCSPSLRYLTGQDVPPGQHPLQRAALSRETVSGLYRGTSAEGTECVLAIMARPLLDGGAAAIFRDVTAQHESEERAQAARTRQAVIQKLCRRLSFAGTADTVAQSVTEETLALLRECPDIQVRLFVFDSASDTLTCLASAPDDRPKRPQSAAEAQPMTVRFDAQIPELWQMYVARQSSASGLPLISGGVAIGHLSVTSSTGNVFEAPIVRETLELIASLAALALAGPSASARAAASTAQTDAVREIAGAVGSGRTLAELADLAAAQVKRVTQAAVCTVSVPAGGKLCIIGEAYQDDLLFPETAPDDPRLHGKAIRKAWRTRKIVTHLGLPPDTDDGPWRVFTGSTGLHSIIALPLAERGVLSVYTAGNAPLPGTHRKFLETVAALLSLSPASATGSTDGVN